MSKVRVTLETLIGNVTLLFLSNYDSISHMQFRAVTHERMVRHAMALTRVLVSVELLTRSRITRDLRIGTAVPTH